MGPRPIKETFDEFTLLQEQLVDHTAIDFAQACVKELRDTIKTVPEYQNLQLQTKLPIQKLFSSLENSLKQLQSLRGKEDQINEELIITNKLLSELETQITTGIPSLAKNKNQQHPVRHSSLSNRFEEPSTTIIPNHREPIADLDIDAPAVPPTGHRNDLTVSIPDEPTPPIEAIPIVLNQHVVLAPGGPAVINSPENEPEPSFFISDNRVDNQADEIEISVTENQAPGGPRIEPEIDDESSIYRSSESFEIDEPSSHNEYSIQSPSSSSSDTHSSRSSLSSSSQGVRSQSSSNSSSRSSSTSSQYSDVSSTSHSSQSDFTNSSNSASSTYSSIYDNDYDREDNTHQRRGNAFKELCENCKELGNFYDKNLNNEEQRNLATLTESTLFIIDTLVEEVHDKNLCAALENLATMLKITKHYSKNDDQPMQEVLTRQRIYLENIETILTMSARESAEFNNYDDELSRQYSESHDPESQSRDSSYNDSYTEPSASQSSASRRDSLSTSSSSTSYFSRSNSPSVSSSHHSLFSQSRSHSQQAPAQSINHPEIPVQPTQSRYFSAAEGARSFPGLPEITLLTCESLPDHFRLTPDTIDLLKTEKYNNCITQITDETLSDQDPSKERFACIQLPSGLFNIYRGDELMAQYKGSNERIFNAHRWERAYQHDSKIFNDPLTNEKVDISKVFLATAQQLKDYAIKALQVKTETTPELPSNQTPPTPPGGMSFR